MKRFPLTFKSVLKINKDLYMVHRFEYLMKGNRNFCSGKSYNTEFNRICHFYKNNSCESKFTLEDECYINRKDGSRHNAGCYLFYESEREVYSEDILKNIDDSN